ncbi:hypothetical protein [Novosphingobium beihaiensis]|uniref:Uncharacterized protein n=1 Tax=Novosphingobium beihaiensis TaxID=2930389 RepID=A0ABT0BNY1_9SPHN|nr:hypothetical protein [Novosphingobium beihaiensis]MCJ2186660.1 hypothetical protein [Novosphingobium beihaiensis]
MAIDAKTSSGSPSSGSCETARASGQFGLAPLTGVFYEPPEAVALELALLLPLMTPVLFFAPQAFLLLFLLPPDVHERKGSEHGRDDVASKRLDPAFASILPFAWQTAGQPGFHFEDQIVGFDELKAVVLVSSKPPALLVRCQRTLHLPESGTQLKHDPLAPAFNRISSA